MKSFDPPEEMHARHILVKTEDEAKAIIADLAKGGDFAKIAETQSQDPGSATQGGDLGFFAAGDMVPEFETAAKALKPGEVTKETGEEPVRLPRHQARREAQAAGAGPRSGQGPGQNRR